MADIAAGSGAFRRTAADLRAAGIPVSAIAEAAGVGRG